MSLVVVAEVMGANPKVKVQAEVERAGISPQPFPYHLHRRIRSSSERVVVLRATEKTPLRLDKLLLGVELEPPMAAAPPVVPVAVADKMEVQVRAAAARQGRAMMAARDVNMALVEAAVAPEVLGHPQMILRAV